MVMDTDFVTIELRSPEKKPEKPIQSTIGYFREYCNSTSIHGFRYFGEKRTIFEKIWWGLVFVICLMVCMFYIVNIYKKWDSNPIIVSLATRGEPIYEIPFPAVTVCSESKVKTNSFNYTEALIKKIRGQNLSETGEKIFGYLSFICEERHYLNYETLNNASTDDFLEIINEITPDFTINNCEFLGDSYRCSSLFTRIITDDGICYTFNLLDRKDLFQESVVHYSDFHEFGKNSNNWSIEHGYKTNDIVTYPRRALLAGARYALKFDLKTSAEKPSDSTCRNSIQGFRILFHAPVRLPRLSQQYIRVPSNKALTAAIRPSQIMTSDAVKNYPASKRKCIFSSETQMKYFKVYSQTNCEIECLTDFTLFFCDCVAFFMPRQNDTKICNAASYDCIKETEYLLQNVKLHDKIVVEDSEKVDFGNCECLPLCTDLEYKIETSQADWDWATQVHDDLNYDDGTRNITECYANITESVNITKCHKNITSTQYHISHITAYFISSSFIGSVRNELYGPTDFLANFGGLLGLFTGFSILSLVEIIYFLTIRLVCNRRLYGYWGGLRS